MNLFNKPSDSERIAFLQIMIVLAKSDGVLADEELSYFYEAGRDLKLSEPTIDILVQESYGIEQNADFIQQKCSIIKSDSLKERLLKELFGLCFVDGEYSEYERNELIAISDYLSFDAFTFRKIEQTYIEKHSESKPALLQRVKKDTDKALQIGKKTTMEIGGKVVDGSKVVAHSVARGLTFLGKKINYTLESAKKAKEENRELRERLKKETLTEAVKQKVITQLGNKIHTLSNQLSVEKARNEKNEEMIALLQAQIDDLLLTMDVAEKAKTE